MCKGKRKAVSKITAVLLTMMMAVTFIPTYAFATEAVPDDRTVNQSDQEEVLIDSEQEPEVITEDAAGQTDAKALSSPAPETPDPVQGDGAKASAMSASPQSITEPMELTGSGTAESPYLIGTEADLREFATLATADDCELCVKLTSDIELTSAWTSIKSQYISTAYKGTFDGDGHTIKNMTISGAGEQGFFGFVRGGTIKNLTIEGSVTSTSTQAGGIVGKLAFGTISNCSFKGTVTTSSSNSNGDAGGIVGYAGFSGSSTLKTTISGCSSCANITSGKYVGGITGRIKWGDIENSYSTGSVNGTTRSGGIAGQALNTCELTNCYSIAQNNGASSTKADIVDFVSAQTTLNNCYYTDSLKGNDSGTVTGGGVIDKSTLLTNLGNAFAADSNNINNGYPILAWEGGSAPQPQDPEIKITGNAPLYMTNSGTQTKGKLTVAFTAMDAAPVQWTITSGSDVISIAAAEDAGDNNISQVVTPLKAGKATVKAQTVDGRYTDEVEVLVYPYITAITMNGNPIAGEEYSVDVTVLGGDPYDYANYPELNTFTWRYFDSKSAYQSNPNGGTTITGQKGRTITVPADLAGKWLTVTLVWQGENKTPGSPYGKDILAERVAVTGVNIEGATASGDELTAQTGTTLTAAATGPDGKTPTNVTYQWAEKAADGTQFVDIEGATGQSYKVPDKRASMGKQFRVKANGENNSTATSAAVTINEMSEAAIAAEQDEAVLEEAIGKYSSMNVLAPKFGENDNNVAKFLQADIAAKGYEGITVSVKSVEKAGFPNGGVAAIANNGNITWFYPTEPDDPTAISGSPYSNMPYARFAVTFTLTKGDAQAEMTKNIDINWDNDLLCGFLQNNMLNAITWDTIKGENATELTAMTNLALPKYPKNSDTRLVSFAWTSSDTDAIEIKDPTGDADTVAYGDRIGKVKRSTEDKTVTLTAHVTYAQTNNVAGTETAIAQLKKEFTVTVPAYTQEEIEALVTKELNQKIDDALAAKGLTDYATGERIDMDNVTGDIQFPTTKDLKIDGAVQPVTITSDNTDVIDYPRDKDDPTKPQKNAARVYVFRPLPGGEAQTVKLTWTITDTEKGVAVSREFNVTVKPLTETELNDAQTFMTAAINGYWDGLKGTNTDPASVSSNLTPFDEIQQGDDGTLTYIRGAINTKGTGVKPDNYVEIPTGADSDYRKFNLSDNTYIADDTLVLAEELPEQGAQVTIDSYLSHAVYGEYYKKYTDAGNNEAAELFKPFYRQHAEVMITIKGPHIHKLVHYDAKAATDKEDGNIEYWLCSGCGKYFADENGNKELTKDEVIIPKTGGGASAATPAKAGTVLQSGNNSYTVTSADSANPTVALKGSTAGGTLTVPADVTVNGVKYKVTAIAPKAFFKNKKLKKVNVGANIITIGAKAFSKCKKLKTFTVGANVEKIDASCFAGSKKLKTLIIKSKKLTKNGVKNALKGSKVKTVKVKVGNKSVNKQYVKIYKKFFTKKNCGKKVKVK